MIRTRAWTLRCKRRLIRSTISAARVTPNVGRMMKILCTLIMITLSCSCRSSSAQRMAIPGADTEADLKATLAAVGIMPAFPVSGFIRFKQLGESVPGVSQSDLIAYGDSYGIFTIVAPAEIADDKLNQWAMEYNRISLEKLRALNEDQKGQQSGPGYPPQGVGSPDP